MKKPAEINILGINYKVEYVDNPSDVDIYKRESLWGQIDYWTRTIRIYDNGRCAQDIWNSILHEVLHGIETRLHLKCFKSENRERGHEELDIIANTLLDVMVRNGWLDLEGK